MEAKIVMNKIKLDDSNSIVIGGKRVCATCNGFDRRYIDSPCPVCGAKYTIHKKSKEVSEERVNVATQGDIAVIPEHYKKKVWSKSELCSNKVNDTKNNFFMRIVQQMDKFHSIFSRGSLPAKSLILIAPPRYSKMTFAYSCMQLALENGYSVSPLLDTSEVKRLVMLSSERPERKTYNKFDFDEYMTADVVFITVTKSEQHKNSWNIILEILDKRSRLGKATYFISRFNLDEIARWDLGGQFKNLGIVDPTADPLKYPVVLQYQKFIKDKEED